MNLGMISVAIQIGPLRPKFEGHKYRCPKTLSQRFTFHPKNSASSLSQPHLSVITGSIQKAELYLHVVRMER